MQIGASEGKEEERTQFISSYEAHTLQRVLDFNRRSVKYYFTVQQKFRNHQNQIYGIFYINENYKGVFFV
jgi:hypothetical protein